MVANPIQGVVGLGLVLFVWYTMTSIIVCRTSSNPPSNEMMIISSATRRTSALPG